MARVSLYRKVCGIVAVATMFSSSVAYAAPVAARQIPSSSISPIVALSLFASSQSRVALCGSAATVAATSAAATTAQAAPAQGCVLPAVDAPVVPVAEAPVMVPVAVAQSSPFISPLLLGLGAIALGIGLLALLRDNDNNQPISPN